MSWSGAPTIRRRSYLVRTRGELEDALEGTKARDGRFDLIDVRFDKFDFPNALKRLGAQLSKAATEAS